MATRSIIGIRNEDGNVREIYCHWDGYPSWNGKILKEHYTTPEKINELMDLGNLSILGSKINPEDGVEHTFDKPVDGVCVAYGRDRGDDKQEALQNFTDTLVGDEEYNYLFKDGKWLVSFNNSQKYRELTDEIIEIY